MTTLTLTETKRTLQEAYLARVRAEWQAAVDSEYEKVARRKIFTAEATENLHSLGPIVAGAAARFVCEQHGDLLRTYVRSFHGTRLGESFSTTDLPEIFPGVSLRVSAP